METIAHRGLHHAVPENTLDAFQCAVDAGVFTIETDLRCTRDDRLVLFHDRLIGDTATESLTHQELNELAGYRVPLWTEAWQKFPQVNWLLEMKSARSQPPLVEMLPGLLDRHNITVISFRHDLILDLARRVHCPCGLSLGGAPVGLSAGAKAARQQFPHLTTIVWNYEFLAVDLLADARAEHW